MDTVRLYCVRTSYRDTGKQGPEDQFLGWINRPGSGMLNTPGIRPLRYVDRAMDVPAYLILVTNHLKGSAFKRWEDEIDLESRRILYWGDAKHGGERAWSSFPGNKVLEQVWKCVEQDRRADVPPILHFSKRQSGQVTFNGLCVLRNLTVGHFLDDGHLVQNYLADLEILPEPNVNVDWLQSRAVAETDADLPAGLPPAWAQYVAGDLRGHIDDPEPYQPHDGDEREAVIRQIKERRGRAAFRMALLRRYRGRCLVTGCNVEAVLEAAHICPHRGEQDDHPANGLLLRADIHTLFDLDLLAVNPDGFRVEFHPDVCGEYESYLGRSLLCTDGPTPSKDALQKRYQVFRQSLGG
jgi:hypothetical protein